MPDVISSGNDLNSYQGNAGLGTGEASGYRPKIDLDPLKEYALRKYQTNLVDYEQQQKDKAKLEEEFTDPKLYQFVDKPLADQINPKLDRLKELAKKNLQMRPNSDDWYEFHNTYNQILKDNAQAKTVQTLKDKAKQDAGLAADPHEREKLLAYADQLDKYKLGDEVPAYSKYFGVDEKHFPSLETATGTMQKVVGDRVQTIKYTTTNALNAPEKTNKILTEHPEAIQTAKDLAHNVLESGSIDTLNGSIEDAFDKSMRLNVDQLESKYKPELDKYRKANPTGTLRDFLNSTGRLAELDNIYQGHDYLKPLKYIPISADGGVELPGFTYGVNPQTGEKMRLDKSDVDLLSIYGATRKPPGIKEEVIKDELSITPKDKFEAGVKKQMNDADNAQRERESRRDDATKRYIAGLKDYGDGKTAKAPELPFTPLPSMVASIGGYNKRVPLSALPVSQIAAINPNWLDKTGALKLATEIGDIQVSIGTRADGTDGVFVVNNLKGKQTKETINESKLKSNAESWLATNAKERKGQEVYGYIDELYNAAKGKNLSTSQSGQTISGLKEKGNIDLDKQPDVPNPFIGGRSTVWSMSIGTDDGEVLISRVTPQGKVMTEKEAIDYYKKTGKHLGIFNSPDAATKYAKQLHDDYESGKQSSVKKDGASIPTLTTKSQFDALPKGAFYYRDGKKYQK